MINIKVDNRDVLVAMRQLSDKTSNLANVLEDIGEHLTETTKRRFDTSTAPDGSKWSDNTHTTILNYIGEFKDSYTKKGNLSKAGSGRIASKKPLVGKTKDLMILINPKVHGNNSVEIGSPTPYAAIQQFGGRKSEFAHLWGDIPARPFLGISDDDRRDILDMLAEYLTL